MTISRNIYSALIFSCVLAFSQAALSAEKLISSPVNINTADAATIAKNLKGIGLSRAQDIISYRQTVGEFKSLEELTEIRGIGVKTVKANEHLIQLK